MTLCNLKIRSLILRIFNFKGGVSWVLLCFMFHGLPYAVGQYQTVPAPPPPFNGFPPIGPKFNPSMAIVMVLLICTFFFLGFFSVYIRQCAERGIRGGNFNGSFGLGRLSRRVARGLDPAVIESFPTFPYSAVKNLRIRKCALECAVCLNEFEDDETLRLIPNCNHVFHPDCIDAWLYSHSTCPVCRANLVPKPGEDHSGATFQIIYPDAETETESQHDNDDGNEARINVIESSPDVNLISNPVVAVTENRPPRSRSTGWSLTALFPRSHSTGHSLVQRGGDSERFTLRLPEEARRELMTSTLNRTTSCVALPRAASSRRGYRSRSGGRYERIERPDGWGSTLTPPFFTRAGSLRSSISTSTDQAVGTLPKGLFKSVRSPFDQLVFGRDEETGERSSDLLRHESQV
ncbi:hypothetical protein SLEP1_g42116 [Rubroshorea leprosula]|uniref:RING-type E3 ubiquitin transferase n=1 Tax=Rubroshorea leprosula TaxID=152421 RepID=A0AAV5L8S5_9ROSI|nr:hypothetical protein SLEP1_g42116 [Rubroshorea leprosula]